MKIDVLDPMAINLEILDLDTGKFLKGIQWANQETGHYCYIKYIESETEIIFEKCELCEEIKKYYAQGNIVFVYKGE